MPYIDGKRVTLEEWQAKHGSTLQRLHTGPGGENPAPPATAPDADEVTEPKPARSPRSAASAAAAIANAMGITPAEVVARGIDPSTNDAPAASAEVASLACDAPDCGFIAKTEFGLKAHKRLKHKEPA